MTDLAAQIIAALDRAEETAQAATPGPWEAWSGASGGGGEYVAAVDYSFGITPGLTGRWDLAARDAAHIAANDPAHVLRLTTALREVVKMHAEPHKWCGGEVYMDYEQPGVVCDTLRALASVWDVPGDNT